MKAYLKEVFQQGHLFVYFTVALWLNLVVVGPLYSYLGVKPLLWFGRSFLALGFFVFFPVLIKDSLNRASYLVAVFLVFCIFIAFFYTPGIDLKITAFKDYILSAISILFVLFLKVDEKKSELIIKSLTVIVIFQFPFVLQQYFVEARSSSVREFDWDLIVGTFGFNPEGGGGNSAGFILFLCFYMVVAFAKSRQIKLNSLEKVAASSALVMSFMAETKIFVILVFFAVFCIYKSREFLNPIKLVIGFSAASVLSVALLYSYSSEKNSNDGVGISEYVNKLYEDYFLNEVANFETGEVGRITAMKIWYSYHHNRYWPVESYIGWGLTSSKSSNSGVPDAVSNGSLISFASTQAATYLWDLGIVGFLIFYLVVVLLIFKRFNTIYIPELPCFSALLNASKFIFISCLIYPFYSQTLHSSTTSQMLVLVALMCTFSLRKGS